MLVSPWRGTGRDLAHMIEPLAPPEPDPAPASQERWGRVVLGAMFGLWLVLSSAIALLIAVQPKVSQWPVLLRFGALALRIGLFYLVWIGQRWARWLLVGLCAVAFVRSIGLLIADPGILNVVFSCIYLGSGGLLAFFKPIEAFLYYQRARRLDLTHRHRRRVRITVAGLLVAGTTAALFSYAHLRNKWPESVKHGLAELKANGVPITLAECDRKYRALGSDPEAVGHFQRAFAAMGKEQPPLMAPQQITQLKPRFILPRLAAMAEPEERAAVVSCLQSNGEALRLLHEGLSYDRCLFPMNLADGFRTLLPHLKPCERAGHLLALESIENIYRDDAAKAGGALLASLHMAEILDNEPTLVGIHIRNRMLVTVCVSLRTCLNVAPLSRQDLALISTRLNGALSKSEDGVLSALVYERCSGMSIFQSSDREIADFLDQGQGRLAVRLSVEGIRVAGILQRDAAYFLQQLDRLEAAVQNSSRQRMGAEFAYIASDLERNQHLLSVDKKQMNIISCMLLPGAVRAMQAHLWARTFGDVTLTSLAVERYRQEVGGPPTDLQSLVPRFLPKIPENPFTDQPLGFRLLPMGYIISSGNVGSHEDGSTRKDKAPFAPDDIVFWVGR